MTTGVIVMTQYLLAIHRDYAVPRSPERTRQTWAGVVALNEAIRAGVAEAEADAITRDASHA
jgi:hypothetical protein